MTPPLHAFVDESSRRNSYAICAATISIDDLDSTRKQLRALLLAGQRRIHFTTESDSRRRKTQTFTTCTSNQLGNRCYGSPMQSHGHGAATVDGKPQSNDRAWSPMCSPSPEKRKTRPLTVRRGAGFTTAGYCPWCYQYRLSATILQPPFQTMPALLTRLPRASRLAVPSGT